MRDPRVLIASSFLFVGAGLWLFTRRAVAAPSPYYDGGAGAPGSFDIGSALDGIAAQADVFVSDVVDAVTFGNAITAAQADDALQSANVRAFLMMIRYAEGTAGADGYNTLVGGGRFDSFADHPRQAITINSAGKKITSTAAGAYQFLSSTWDDARRAMGLYDFSPINQDRGAVWLVARRGALDDAIAGRFDSAVQRCAREWASLPGSPYGQPVRTLDQVRQVYASAGGVIV